MTPNSRRMLVVDLMDAEGFREKPYLDCCGRTWRECACERKGKLTIGYGRNLDDVGISKLEAEVLLEHDAFKAEDICKRSFDWFTFLNDFRQRAVTELVFNMGPVAFRGFRQTIQALKAGQYKAAAYHLLDSRWKGQVGDRRSERIARYLRDGG